MSVSPLGRHEETMCQIRILCVGDRMSRFWSPLNIGLRKSPKLLVHYYKVYFFAPISQVAHGVLQAGRPAAPFFNSVRKSMINPAVHPPIIAVSAK